MFVCKGGEFCSGCSVEDYREPEKTHNQDVIYVHENIPNSGAVYYELVSNCNSDIDLGILQTDNDDDVKENRKVKALI